MLHASGELADFNTQACGDPVTQPLINDLNNQKNSVYGALGADYYPLIDAFILGNV